MNGPSSSRAAELALLKLIIDERWEANEAVLLKSLPQGMITWRKKKEGGFEVKIKPELS
jgi:hypothetical protein